MHNPLKKHDLNELATAAESVMEANLHEVEGKLFAMPNKALYPAAWGWDTPQIAAGLYAGKPDTALRLMEDFLSYQWENGMVPQIVFPTLKEGERFDKDAYFPGPHVWYMEGAQIRDYANAPDADFASHPAYQASGGKTTAIPQYPIWALNLKQMQDEKPIDPARLAPLVEKINRFHEYFHQECDPENLGIVAELHPWLGCDNAPPYDKAMHRVASTATPEELALVKAQRVDVKRVVDAGGDPSHRPTDEDYAAFLKIAHGVGSAIGKRMNGEDVSTNDLPFVMYSPMLNGMLLRAEEDLASLAKAAGKPDIAKEATERATSLRSAMMHELWDEKTQGFAYLDAKTGEREQVAFLGSLFPLLDPKLPQEARTALEKTLDRDFVQGFAAPIPTTARSNPERVEGKAGFEPCYWRGPMWLNMSEMLRPYTKDPEALRDQSLALVEREGFREYFDSETGEGLGSNNFSWSAANTARMAREALQEQSHFQNLVGRDSVSNRGRG